jgi:hypothetical protein
MQADVTDEEAVRGGIQKYDPLAHDEPTATSRYPLLLQEGCTMLIAAASTRGAVSTHTLQTLDGSLHTRVMFLRIRPPFCQHVPTRATRVRQALARAGYCR